LAEVSAIYTEIIKLPALCVTENSVSELHNIRQVHKVLYCAFRQCKQLNSSFQSNGTLKPSALNITGRTIGSAVQHLLLTTRKRKWLRGRF